MRSSNTQQPSSREAPSSKHQGPKLRASRLGPRVCGGVPVRGPAHPRLSGWDLGFGTWSFSGAWSLGLGALLLLLAGCAAPIGAERVSARQAYGQVDANALRTGHRSPAPAPFPDRDGPAGLWFAGTLFAP